MNGVITTYQLDLNMGLTQVLSDGTDTYLYGLGRIGEQAGSTWEYHLSDAQGSVRQLVDDASQVAFAQSYEPFGDVLTSSGVVNSSYGYTGEWTDSSGLLFLRERYYSPELGIFTTKDSFSGYPTLPQSMNGFNYAYGNPINLTDPSGNDPILWTCLLAIADGVLPIGDALCLTAIAASGGLAVVAYYEALENAPDIASELACLFQDLETDLRTWTWEDIYNLPIAGTFPQPEPEPETTPVPPIITTDDDDNWIQVRHYSKNAIYAIQDTMVIIDFSGRNKIWIEFPIITGYDKNSVQTTTTAFKRPLDGQGGFVEFWVNTSEWSIAHDPDLPGVINASVINLPAGRTAYPLYEPGVFPRFYDFAGNPLE